MLDSANMKHGTPLSLSPRTGICHAAQLLTATVEQGHSLNGSALQFQDSGSQAVGPGPQQRDFGVSTWRTEEMWVRSRKGCCDEIWPEAPSELLPSKIKGGDSPRQAHPPTPIPRAIMKHYTTMPGGSLLTSGLGKKW